VASVASNNRDYEFDSYVLPKPMRCTLADGIK
jgi:hypothetical protein